MKTMKEINEFIIDQGFDDVIVFNDFVTAFEGITINGRAVYNYRKMVESFCKENDCSEEEAEEYISYNTIRSLPYMGERAPIIMLGLEE